MIFLHLEHKGSLQFRAAAAAPHSLVCMDFPFPDIMDEPYNVHNDFLPLPVKDFFLLKPYLFLFIYLFFACRLELPSGKESCC